MPEGVGYPDLDTALPTEEREPVLDLDQPAFDPREVAAGLFSTMLDHVQGGGLIPGLTSEGAGQGFDPQPLLDKYTLQFPDGTTEEIETGEEATDDGHDHGVSTGSLAWGGHRNGRIPDSALTSVGGGHKMEASAAAAWNRMVADAAKDGVTLSLTDSYRSYDAQVKVRQEKGHKVATATPGTSIHGWGKAVDISGAAAQKWVHENGARYGWIWPEWAQRKGTKSYEPWHHEFVGAPRTSSGGAPRSVM